MNLQFISDSTGQTTGVYIPIKEWNELKSKFKGIADEEIDVPAWHQDEVRKRVAEHNMHDFIDFDKAIDDIEKGL